MNDNAIQVAKAQIEAARRAVGKPVIRTFFDEPTFTATHVVHDPVSRRAAIIDSVLDFDQAAGRTSHGSADALIAYVREQDLTIEWLLEKLMPTPIICRMHPISSSNSAALWSSGAKS